MKSTAVYPGTFDPVTNGHIDIIERGLVIFEELIVAVAGNPHKNPVFTPAERVDLITKAMGKRKGLVVESFGGLLISYVKGRGANVIVRGIRAVSDFEYEFQMALMNRKMDSEIETVFMMPSEAYSYLSSKLVKEVVALGGKATGLVPPLVEKRLRERLSLLEIKKRGVSI
jgi:pantetheine-phosphate adenylyltransferase